MHAPSTQETQDYDLRSGREAQQQIALIAEPAPDAVTELEPSGDDRERVFWFRWIIGHQITFICWQLLAAALADHEAARNRDIALERMRCYIRGYSLMLLYSGSCPQTSYAPVIRTPMARQHRHLTGLWARDYGAVRGLLHGKVALGDSPRAQAVAAECQLNGDVHSGIATKLVPTGPSLLQATAEAENRTFRMSRESLLTLYDCTFMTVRDDVSLTGIAAQLLRRLRAVVMDLAANRLFPEWAPGTAEEMAQLDTPDITNCATTMVESIVEIARSVFW
jgi:hypothetical protein